MSPADPPPEKESGAPLERPERPSFIAELKRRKVFRVAITYAVVAWLIIQIAAATFGGFGIPEWAFRFVVIMLVLGFPVALIITWAFELTPEGVKLTKHVSESEQAEASPGKRNGFAFAFAAGLPTLIFGTLALYFFFSRSLTEQEDPASDSRSSVSAEAEEMDKSIAVLPFSNRRELKSDEFFTDGIHDDLLTQISRIRDFKTISRTSVMAYRGTTKNMREIGEELGVANLLEGGVQRSGNHIRINMQLIDAKTDAHLWAETYTREMTAENVFAIQSEITGAITKALKSVLSPEEQKHLQQLPTQNLEALEAYFQAKTHMAEITSAGFLEAIPLLLKALELDPGYVDAHALLANAYISRIYFGGDPAAEQVAKARPHIERALEIDELNEDAWVQLGMMKRYEELLEESKAAYHRVIEINPNYAPGYQSMGLLLQWSYFDAKAAVPYYKKASDLDPLSLHAKSQLAEALSSVGERDEALAIMLELVEQEPERALYHLNLGKVYAENFERYDLAVKSLRLAYNLDPKNSEVMYDLAVYYRNLGDRESQMWWYERILETMPNHYSSKEYQVVVHLLKGEREEALQGMRTIGTDSDWASYMLNRRYVLEKSPEAKAEVLDLFEQYIAGLSQLSADRTLLPFSSMQYAEVLLLHGETEKAIPYLESFLRKLSDSDEKDLGFYFYSTVANCLLDDKAAALDAFESLMNLGCNWAGDAHIVEASILESIIHNELNGDPEYERLAAIGIARAQEQLNQVRQWETSGVFAPLPEM